MRTALLGKSQQITRAPNSPVVDYLLNNLHGLKIALLKSKARLLNLDSELTSNKSEPTIDPISWKGECNGNRTET
jgi:hypothetical protein